MKLLINRFLLFFYLTFFVSNIQCVDRVIDLYYQTGFPISVSTLGVDAYYVELKTELRDQSSSALLSSLKNSGVRSISFPGRSTAANFDWQINGAANASEWPNVVPNSEHMNW
jgi:hypothetical protein